MERWKQQGYFRHRKATAQVRKYAFKNDNRREYRYSGALIVIWGLLSWGSRGGIWLLRIWFACFSILTDRFLSYITIFLFPSHNASDDKHVHVIRWKIGGSPLIAHSEDTVCSPAHVSKTSLGLISTPAPPTGKVRN